MYLTVAILCILGLCILTSYEVLKKQRKDRSDNTILFWMAFIGMCLMLSSWVVLGRFDPVHLLFLLMVRWVGLLAVLVAAGLSLSGIIKLRGLENIDHLVTDGIFARIRHPMYTGFILWIAGWAIFYSGTASLGLAALCISKILLWRSFEEASLLKRYAGAFEEYRRKTWF